MADTTVRLPSDTSNTGSYLRHRSRILGGLTVLEQATFQAANPTWWVYVSGITPAANKWWLSMLNAAGSGQVIRVKKLFILNLGTASVTGAAMSLNMSKVTAHSGGTTITPIAVDSTDVALTSFTCLTGATVTAGSVMAAQMSLSEENTATQAFTTSQFQALTNLMLEDVELKEVTLNPGEGFGLQQITSVTTGTMGVLASLTREN